MSEIVNSLQNNLLPEDFKVHIEPNGNIVNLPTVDYEDKVLPTVNLYQEPDGGYITCYSRNQEGSIYSVGNDIYVMGQIRLQGKYINGIFYPDGYEKQNLSSVPELKDLCNRTFPACKGDCWAGSNNRGWFGLQPDPVDPRDKSIDLPHPESLPATVDLREWCSPVKHQGKLNSCTAHSAAALVEYFQNRVYGKHIDVSRLFLYKVTRNLLNWEGDKGAYTRTTMKALTMIGVPPEKFWLYDETKFEEEPPAFCYALADRYRTTEYYRIDTPNKPKNTVLQDVKTLLARNRPSMFSVLVYTSCWQQAISTGKIPFPAATDTRWGGMHNMVVVGYDDKIKIRNTDDSSIESTGAFLVKNSAGVEWGDKGYGWLPYDYLLKQQTIDWWTIVNQNWLDTDIFGKDE